VPFLFLFFSTHGCTYLLLECADENTTGCAYGYVNKNGSSNVQTGVLRGRGGGEKVASCARCASLCSSTSACMSYQCSPTTLECSLYSAYSPTGVAQADFAFCFKNGQSCSFGYHSIYGNVLGLLSSLHCLHTDSFMDVRQVMVASGHMEATKTCPAAYVPITALRSRRASPTVATMPRSCATSIPSVLPMHPLRRMSFFVARMVQTSRFVEKHLKVSTLIQIMYLRHIRS